MTRSRCAVQPSSRLAGDSGLLMMSNALYQQIRGKTRVRPGRGRPAIIQPPESALGLAIWRSPRRVRQPVADGTGFRAVRSATFVRVCVEETRTG